MMGFYFAAGWDLTPIILGCGAQRKARGRGGRTAGISRVSPGGRTTTRRAISISRKTSNYQGLRCESNFERE